MPKIKNPLTEKQIKAFKCKSGQVSTDYAVGGVKGLYVRCLNSGVKNWRLRLTINGKIQTFGIGPYPEISLKDARLEGQKIRDQKNKGLNPAEERQKKKARKINLFSDVTYMFYKTKIIPELKNEKHKKNWIAQIEKYIFPAIGGLDIKDIKTGHIIKVIEPIWTGKHETASRLRQRLEAIFDYAMAANILERGFNPATWKGNLDQLLPSLSSFKKEEKHLPSLPPEELGNFLTDLRETNGISARVLEFIIFTACRSGEARLAIWNEIDFGNKIWTIPAGRIKGTKKHRIPLSKQAIKILNGIPRLSEYIFTAPKGGFLTSESISKVIKNLDKKGKTYLDPVVNRLVVPHGFRSSFKDWARQPVRYGHSSYSDELSELALAHVNSDQTRAAYARNELLEERRPLMQDWANFCEGKKSIGEVIELKGANNG
ncbi:MAG: tyrosine-type recombinase/integrase [Bacillota bacterium]